MAKDVSKGERLHFKAAEYNAAVAAGQDYLRGKHSAEAGSLVGSRQDGTQILIANNSGYFRARFDVLGIDAPIILPSVGQDEFANRIMFGGSLPNPTHVGRFCILQQPLDAGGVGRAILAGVTTARVAVTTDTDSAIIAGPRLGTPGYLEAGVAGARILWREPGVGVKWAIVRLFEVGGGAFGRVFYNDSGETMPGWGVGRVTGYALSTQAGGYVYSVGKPNTTFERLYLINSPMPVRYGAFGVGFFLEDSFVAFDTGDSTPAVGESWGPKPGQWTLAKKRYGFTCLGGVNTSLGVFRAQQHLVNYVIGKSYGAAINKSASGTVKVYAGTLDTTQQITAWNRFANVAQDKWVGASWIGGGWDLTAAEC